MLDNLAKWSAARLFLTLLIAGFLFLDAISYMTSSLPGCVIHKASYGQYYAENNECPTFDIFLIKNFTRIFEAIGGLNLFIAVLLVLLIVIVVWQIIAKWIYPRFAPVHCGFI